MNNVIAIEALLFVSGKSMTLSQLQKLIGIPKSEIENALTSLGSLLADRGIRLMEHEGEFSLVTSPDLGELMQKYHQDEMKSNLSKSALETITIILYKSPVTRAEIDFIRGVNSTYILQSLLIRGLIERTVNPKDSRTYLYKPTRDFLKYCGLTNLRELPDYSELRGLRKTEIQEALANSEQVVGENVS